MDDFFHGRPGAAANALARLRDDDVLACGLTVAELLRGVRRDRQRTTIERYLLDMEWLSPREPEIYLATARLFRDLRARGVTVRSTIDCIVARLAAEGGAYLLARDRDLERIAESGLLDLAMLPTER